MPERAQDYAPPSEADVEKIVRTALTIRALETKLLDLYAANLLGGTVHTCVGQEFCAAALYDYLRPGVDAVFSNHRGHGHFVAYGGDLAAFLAELLGREGALCGGRGGSQHLHEGRFFSTGIQGGLVPVAVGFAWALKRREPGAITVAHLGDGTLGEGAVYEALTFAALLEVPLLFVLENNGYAQSTDTTTTTPGDLLQRIAGFGIEVDRTTDTDWPALHAHLGAVVSRVRSGKPFFQIIDTRRLMAHSKGDDTRSSETIARLWKEDPLQQLIEADRPTRESYKQAGAEIDTLVEEILARPALRFDQGAAVFPATEGIDRTSLSLSSDAAPASEHRTIAECLNRELRTIMNESSDVLLIGEDLLDPYGGAFKVARGLSTAFPDRVFSTPIAEAGIVGTAGGLALAGLRPIAEIMFSDFATLAADQIINHLAKFFYMWGGRTKCPVTVRLVSGGGRGYGPTHSQSLETLFCGVPGLRVLALSQRHQAGALLRAAVLDDGPVIFVEHKSLYTRVPEPQPPLDMEAVPLACNPGDFPPLHYHTDHQAADATVVSYGFAGTWAEEAMRVLCLEEELSFDYFILTQLWPLRVEHIAASVEQTKRLIVVEESVPTYGVGAAVVSSVVQAGAGRTR
ncbi:MAG: pyruvate dehydrogenase [Planctomycetes bacterium]|nr:pyruvate dehydrogenase [Planctomycetota bacterium]